MTTFPQVRGGFVRYNERAQNGPGNAVVAHRPGPDLSASLTTDEEH